MRFLLASAVCVALFVPTMASLAAGPEDWYYREGPLRGSLKSDKPLPLYDSHPEHLWNRLFAVFYIRPSELPSRPEYPKDSTKLDEWDRKLRAGKLPLGPVVKRLEGGDTMGLLAWPRTRYYSEPGTFARADKLLDGFIAAHGERLIADPLKRAFFQRDLWAVFDHLVGQNIARFGDGDLLRRGALNRDVYGDEPDAVPFDDPQATQRREILCRKLAKIIQRLALPKAVIQSLPDNYAAAIRCGHFASRHDFDCQSNYLPPGLLTRPDEWVEIDTSSESLPHFKEEGQMDYVAWSIRGRSALSPATTRCPLETAAGGLPPPGRVCARPAGSGSKSTWRLSRGGVPRNNSHAGSTNRPLEGVPDVARGGFHAIVQLEDPRIANRRRSVTGRLSSWWGKPLCLLKRNEDDEDRHCRLVGCSRVCDPSSG